MQTHQKILLCYVLITANLPFFSIPLHAQEQAISPDKNSNTNDKPGGLKTLKFDADAVVAENGPLAANTHAKKKGTMTEIVVTGTREDSETAGTALFGSGDLREVPFSVNVVTEEELINRQVGNLAEALAYDPAVTPSYGATGAYQDNALFVRGFELRDNSNTLLDGSPMYGGTILATEDLTRVEVLRGPAAFRTGFVSPGGVINLVRKRPTDTSLLKLNTSYDSWGLLTAHLDAGGRGGNEDQFGYRVNLLKSHGNWFVGDIGLDRTFGSGTFDYRFTATTIATVSFSQNKTHMDGDMFHWTQLDTNGKLLKNIDFELDWGQPWAFSDVDNSAISFNLESDLTDSTHFSTTLLYSDVYNNQSYTGPSAAPDLQGNYKVANYHFKIKGPTVSNTTYLVTNFNTGGIEHHLSYGGSWVKTKSEYYSGSNYDIGTNNFFHPVVLPDPKLVVPTSPTYDSVFTQTGIFVSDQLDFSKTWHGLIALRQSKIDQDWFNTQTKNDALTPSLGLMYDLTPKVRLYTSLSQGVEVGGIAPETTGSGKVVVNHGEHMGPIDSTQYEVGLKADLWSGKMELNTALFDITRMTEYLNEETATYVQDGEQHHKGIEVGLKGHPVQNFELGLGFQYLNAKIENTDDPRLVGARPNGVPEWTASFNGDYSFPQMEKLHLVLGLIYVGNRIAGYDPDQQDTMDGYLRVDTNIRYQTDLIGKETTMRLGIENLGNKKYFSASYYDIQEPGLPRSITASVEMNF